MVRSTPAHSAAHGRHHRELRGEVIEQLVELLNRERAEVAAGSARFPVDEYPRRLSGYAQPRSHLTVAVQRLRYLLEVVSYHKGLRGFGCVPSSDSEDDHLAVIAPRNLRDIGSFPIAHRSPRRPEPQSHVPANQAGPVDRAPDKGRQLPVQDGGDGWWGGFWLGRRRDTGRRSGARRWGRDG